jgi:hypothetical protein
MGEGLTARTTTGGFVESFFVIRALGFASCDKRVQLLEALLKTSSSFERLDLQAAKSAHNYRGLR